MHSKSQTPAALGADGTEITDTIVEAMHTEALPSLPFSCCLPCDLALVVSRVESYRLLALPQNNRHAQIDQVCTGLAYCLTTQLSTFVQNSSSSATATQHNMLPQLCSGQLLRSLQPAISVLQAAVQSASGSICRPYSGTPTSQETRTAYEHCAQLVRCEQQPASAGMPAMLC